MRSQSNSANETLIRSLYAVAETKDSKAFTNLFTQDGYFYDVSAGVKYYGDDLGKTVDIYAKAFPDMHRELIEFYVKDDENVVIVELTLNGTQKGPLELPVGTIPPTGKVMQTPCCDVFHIVDGKVQSFHCYTAGTIMLGQLGILGNLGAALQK
jgi:ketosteroid isomerase-like protein